MTEEERGRKNQGQDREFSRRGSIAGPGAVRPGGEGSLPPREAPPPVELLGQRRKGMVPERKYSFETPPEPIPASSIKETITSEVVVVGAGLAGICATLSAVEAGARVTLIEKMSTFQARSTENAFIGSRIQKELGVEIDRDELILNLMKYAANKPDQRLIRMWAEKGGEIADWLFDMADEAGISVRLNQFPPPPDFDNATEYYPQYLVTHIFSDRQMAQYVLDKALEKGAVVHYDIRAKQLIRKGKGRVTGVIVQNAYGEYIQYDATKAIILCTGDYGNNAEMMAKYCPQAAYLPSLLPTSTGDGHQMAMWIGAVMELAPHAPISHGFAGPLGTNAFLQVNLKGERFQNEDVPGQSYTNQIERQPGQTAWQVFDSKYPEEVKHMGIGHSKIIEVTPEIRERVESRAISANTIEELGRKMEVPLETFKATIARYNELARLGKDLDFGKRPDRLTTVDKSPYYASKGHYALLVVMGGLNLNAKLQALDKDWEVIPGLYLAGNTMGNRFAVDYPLMAPGISHGMAIVFGRIAGLNAVTLEP